MTSANAMHKQTVIHRAGMTTVHESAGHHTSGWLRMLSMIALPRWVGLDHLTHAQSYRARHPHDRAHRSGGGTDTMARLISQRLSSIGRDAFAITGRSGDGDRAELFSKAVRTAIPS